MILILFIILSFMKKNITLIFNKKLKKKVTCLTSYSFNFTKVIDGLVDVILVGDSMGMVLYGMDNTRNVTDEIMIRHAQAVKKAATKSLVFFDLPYVKKFNEKEMIKRVVKIMKLTNCDGVKIEGNKEIVNVIKSLKKKGIPVMAHLGLQPQQFSSSAKFKIFGRGKNDLINILDDAFLLEKAGAVSILLEGVISNIAKKVTQSINVPTIGIGASKYCDGQILVSEDMLGFFSEYYPKFVKRYGNLSKSIKKSIEKYSLEVQNGKFPSKKFEYN